MGVERCEVESGKWKEEDGRYCCDIPGPDCRKTWRE